jgi:hypothetical protein
MTGLRGQLPTSLGGKAASASLSVTLATDGQFVTSVGAAADGAAASDTASASLVALVKRALANWTSLLTVVGTTADAASASGANTSIVGALRAIRDRLLGTLSVSISARATMAASIQTITASATYSSAAQSAGDTATSPYAFFKAIGNTTTNVTVNLQTTVDGGTWFTIASMTLPAGGGPFVLSAPALNRNWRMQVVNPSANPISAFVSSGFTAA